MSEYVTRAEFEALANEVHGIDRTNHVVLRELGDVKAELGEITVMVRRIARHLGIDTNGAER